MILLVSWLLFFPSVRCLEGIVGLEAYFTGRNLNKAFQLTVCCTGIVAVIFLVHCEMWRAFVTCGVSFFIVV